MFTLFKKPKTATSTETWFRRWDATGLVVSREQINGAQPIDGAALAGYATQLLDDGLALETPDGFLLGWDALFSALNQPDYANLPELLALPPFTDCGINLCSQRSLTDHDFAIAFAGWQTVDGAHFDCALEGPVMASDARVELMRPAQWALFKEVVAFARRATTEHTDLAHRQAWGRIRKLALSANARLDNFLKSSVVLSPEKLEIGLRRSEEVADDRVIEIKLSFANAPPDWLAAFDRNRAVPDRYDIPTPEGIVQILVTPQVRTVLQEIKRLPGRRIAGSRAQAFLLNPYATLGEDAVAVIDEAQFEQAREEAGLTYERFTPIFERDASDYPLRIGLLIETASANGPSLSEQEWLDDPKLAVFTGKLEQALSLKFSLLAWRGFDLEIQGDAARHLADLKAALDRRKAPPTLISFAQVHDLSGYSSRVEAIGTEKPYFSPYIAKKQEGDGWFPENVFRVVVYQAAGASEPIAVPTSKEAIDTLKAQVAAAKASNQSEVSVPWLPSALSIGEAERITQTFDEVFKDIETGSFNPEKPKTAASNTPLGPRKQLVLLANIGSLEYEEGRRKALGSAPKNPKVPQTIRPGYALLPHQRSGLAWLQHLHSTGSAYHVRGAVLADDMGLGKTFQLLALMAGLIESEPGILPMLVVAPVSLLENWADEANKFFQEGALPLLTAYGDTLSSLRVPRSQIDQRLRTEDGLVKFLKPNWIGTAKVVLTTYETLRDFEFSFAAEAWSLMVCDEAQRIKNPAAMVTRAAKKQNVAFKIACTGTPVENTLADIWCLFDYVQPGLLGALNDFGRQYRKPIEAKTEEQKARVEELRTRIAPQILRRMKVEVATDLPEKIVSDECRQLPISAAQRNLYAWAVESFKKRDDPQHSTPFKNHLGLLHYLRLICTDPQPHGLSIFKPEPIKQYRDKAPKLDWLLNQLKTIKVTGEKVIVFCEFRDIQRLLQHYIEIEFGLKPDIINGDTSASGSHTASRQKRIKAFQQLHGFGVIILSPLAVGFGVNIQAANHVVHYTRTWNPAKEDQATDRAYRIGQTKNVYVYHPVVYADDFTTFDVKLDHLLTYKRGLAQDMLNGSGEVASGDFNIVDIVPAAQRLLVDKTVNIDMALRMKWQHFECLVSALWIKQGYDCYKTPASNDNGVDVVALNGGEGLLIQAKTSGVDGATLNWDAVKEVVAGEAFYKRHHPTINFKKVCITNQFFNRQAHENAALNAVELLDQTHLTKLLECHHVSMLDIEKILYADWQPTDAASVFVKQVVV